MGSAAKGDTNGSHGSVESPVYRPDERVVSQERLDKGDHHVLYNCTTSVDTRSGSGGTSASSSSLRLFFLGIAVG